MNANNSLIEIEANTVSDANACPKCGENHVDYLVWNEYDYVTCATCGMVYDPAEEAAQA